jgi:hypothetical protein
MWKPQVLFWRRTWGKTGLTFLIFLIIISYHKNASPASSKILPQNINKGGIILWQKESFIP